MTVSGPYLDSRKPGLPYTLTVRVQADEHIVEHHRYPKRDDGPPAPNV